MIMTPFAFPSTNWGFSYQVDPKLMNPSAWLDFRSKFLNLYLPIYNNFVDHAARRINELAAEDSWLNTKIDNNRASNDSGIKSLQNQINATNATIGGFSAAISDVSSSLKSSVSSLQTQIKDNKASASSGISSLQSQVTNNKKSSDSSVSSLQGQINTLDSWLNEKIDNNAKADSSTKTSLQNQINDNKASATSGVNSLQGQINTLDSWLNEKIDNNAKADSSTKTSLQNQINDNKASATSGVNSLQSQINTMAAANSTGFDDLIATMNNRFKEYFSADSSGYTGGIVSTDGVFTKVIKGQTNRIIDALNAVGSKIKDYTAQLTTLNGSTLLTNTGISSFSAKNREDLTLINATLKGLKNYDDTSFQNKISALFEKYYFTANSYESGIDSTDGIFTKLIKGQFTRLIAELNRQFTLSLTSTTNNIEKFKTYLREEFSLLNDWASLQVDWSKIINDNILVAIAALDKIVAKPNGDVNVNVPPDNIVIPAFDYDRLKEMLSELSFGNVVNEAGTNLWDVLKELIDALGGVLESIMNIVPDLIDRLIALIIPENKNFFTEDVKALTDSFDVKFEWAFNLSNSFKSVFSQPKSLKTLTVLIGGKDYKVVPSFVDLNMIKTILTGYFCFLTLFSSYKRIVGGGDVIQ